jgi:radical SAM-linked protein
MDVMRLRLTFSKNEGMKYTGHLDLHRAWERTLRRANLPLAYSQGYNPRPRINLASALPLGFTSNAEVVDIWLEREIAFDKVNHALRRSTPPGLELISLDHINLTGPSLQSQLEASEYTITLLEPIPDLDAKITQLLMTNELTRERRGKAYNLRPLIIHLERLPDSKEGLPQLVVMLSAQEGATGRPEEVVSELGGSHQAARYHRTRLIFNG